jgi:ATP-dependent helicase HrpA
MNIRVIDAAGNCVAHGRDLARIWSHVDARGLVESGPAVAFEREGIKAWDFGELPEVIEFVQQGVRVKRWTALVDAGDSVALRLCETRERAHRETRAGLRRLLMLQTAQTVKYLRKNLPGLQSVCVQLSSVAGCDELREQLIARSYDEAFHLPSAPPRNGDEFARLLETGRGALVEQANALCGVVGEVAAEYHALRQSLQRAGRPYMADAVRDVQEQVRHLFAPQFVVTTPREWLEQYPRYLKAARLRVDKLERNALRDEQLRREFAPLWQRYVEAIASRSGEREIDAALLEYRWLLEELRVSLFAQEIKTRAVVSVKRLARMWEALEQKSK